MTATGVMVPHSRIPSETLLKLVEEFVTRDGTDYGETEVPTAQKISQVMHLLKAGKAVVVFDPEGSSATILMADDPRAKILAK